MLINKTPLILHVYDGDWSLPSIDLDCIKLLVSIVIICMYNKFIKIINIFIYRLLLN